MSALEALSTFLAAEMLPFSSTRHLQVPRTLFCHSCPQRCSPNTIIWWGRKGSRPLPSGKGSTSPPEPGLVRMALHAGWRPRGGGEGWRHRGTQTRCVSAPGQVQWEPLACPVAAVASEEGTCSCQQDTDFGHPPNSPWICDCPTTTPATQCVPSAENRSAGTGAMGKAVPPASIQLREGPLPQDHRVRECSLKHTFCLLLRRALSGPPPGTSVPSDR